MWPLRRRKNTANTQPAFQGAAEDWLRRPRDADSDAAVLQAVQGRVEVAIPLGAISSGPAGLGGNWGNLVIVLARYDAGSDTWTDDGRAALHYRLSTPADAWIYGNIDTL